jgi:outer membrane protein
MTKSIVHSVCVLLLSLLAAPLVLADEQPANSVRVGAYLIFYHAHADDITGPFVPQHVNLGVKDVQTLYLAYLRELSPHFTAELAFGWPPMTKTYGKGPTSLGSVPYNNQIISSARWLAPTALLEYVFLDPSSALRPYIGVGVNYTTFYDRTSTAAGNAASGGPTRLELKPSVGPAGTIGASYRWNQHWSVAGSFSATVVRTRLTAITDGLVRTSRISFGPQAVVLAGGYSF